MRRLALIMALLGVHCLALLCAAGGLNSVSSTAYRNDAESVVQDASTQIQDQSSVIEATRTPPDGWGESTYEQYRRTRDQPAATMPEASESPAAEPVNPFHVQLNVDFTNAYYFRGILQQDHGLIVQPAAKLLVNLYRHDDLVVDAFAATWNSFGSNGGSNTGQLISDWYECDLIAGLVITKGEFSLTTSYTFLTSPSDAFATVQELDFTLAYDDSGLLGNFSLKPYALLAIETGSVGSDGGDPGVYLELGVGPGFAFDLGRTPVTVTFPVLVGLSLDDYYNFGDGDSTFGFAQAGAKLALPLPFGERIGQWTLNAGVSGLFLSDNLAKVNNGDDFEVIGTIGLQWNF